MHWVGDLQSVLWVPLGSFSFIAPYEFHIPTANFTTPKWTRRQAESKVRQLIIELIPAGIHQKGNLININEFIQLKDKVVWKIKLREMDIVMLTCDCGKDQQEKQTLNSKCKAIELATAVKSCSLVKSFNNKFQCKICLIAPLVGHFNSMKTGYGELSLLLPSVN